MFFLIQCIRRLFERRTYYGLQKHRSYFLDNCILDGIVNDGLFIRSIYDDYNQT